MTDWLLYRKCGTCHVWPGSACKSLSGKVVNGHPDGHEHTLAEPHGSRILRASIRHDSAQAHSPKTCLACRIDAEARRRAAARHA
jgi:hypothetical protein